MIRVEHIVEGSQVSVLRLDHEAGNDHRDAHEKGPQEEICSNYAINLVEAGSFELGVEERRWTLTPGYVFLSEPGAMHRYSHRERKPSDVCVSVIYSKTFVSHRCDDSFPAVGVQVVVPPTNRLGFLKLRLARLTSDRYGLAVEDWACDLLSAIRAGLPTHNRLYKPQQLRWYAERVEAICQLFETRYADPHSLASAAKSVGMSPFQFSRVFSQLAGVPPHQYLLRVRLEQAAKMLLDGGSVTETCFDVGFSNLSHFTRSFRRRFGCVPSLWKTSRSRASIRH